MGLDDRYLYCTVPTMTTTVGCSIFGLRPKQCSPVQLAVTTGSHIVTPATAPRVSWPSLSSYLVILFPRFSPWVEWPGPRDVTLPSLKTVMIIIITIIIIVYHLCAGYLQLGLNIWTHHVYRIHNVSALLCLQLTVRVMLWYNNNNNNNNYYYYYYLSLPLCRVFTIIYL